jgi:hypothetical protein
MKKTNSSNTQKLVCTRMGYRPSDLVGGTHFDRQFVKALPRKKVPCAGMNVWGGNVSICMNSQPHSILMMTQDLQLMNMPQPHPLYPTNTRCFSFSFLLFQFCDIIFLVKISPPKNRDINQIYST